MGYLNEDGLARYDGLIKNWVTLKSGTVDGIDPLLNWQKTETAGAVTCYPLPAAPLDPVVNFAFTETGPAEGTKGPDNPSTITGVTQAKVTRCGKNLCPLVGTPSNSSVSVSFSSDGEFVFNGTTTGVTFVTVFVDANLSIPDYLEIGKTYTFSLYGDESSVFFAFYRYYTTNYGGAIFTIAPGQSYTQTIPDTKGLLLRFTIPANTVLSNAKFKLQIEEGSSATEFEPYAGTDYTIDLGSAYYGGSVDLSAGTMTVTHEGFYATAATTSAGIASSFISGDFAFCLIPAGFAIKYDNTQLTSTRFVTASSGDIERVYCRGGDSFYSLGCYIDKSRLDFSSAVDPSSPTAAEITAAFSAWLASNPTFICVKRTEPITVQLTPTQIYSLSQPNPYTPRLNTVYSDQQSVQIGYPKSPLATSTELTNAIISLGGNI